MSAPGTTSNPAPARETSDEKIARLQRELAAAEREKLYEVIDNGAGFFLLFADETEDAEELRVAGEMVTEAMTCFELWRANHQKEAARRPYLSSPVLALPAMAGERRPAGQGSIQQNGKSFQWRLARDGRVMKSKLWPTRSEAEAELAQVIADPSFVPVEPDGKILVPYSCGRCGSAGHTARSCPWPETAPDGSTVQAAPKRPDGAGTIMRNGSGWRWQVQRQGKKITGVTVPTREAAESGLQAFIAEEVARGEQPAPTAPRSACGKCGRDGHNSRSCDRRAPGTGAVFADGPGFRWSIRLSGVPTAQSRRFATHAECEADLDREVAKRAAESVPAPQPVVATAAAPTSIETASASAAAALGRLGALRGGPARELAAAVPLPAPSVTAKSPPVSAGAQTAREPSPPLENKGPAPVSDQPAPADLESAGGGTAAGREVDVQTPVTLEKPAVAGGREPEPPEPHSPPGRAVAPDPKAIEALVVEGIPSAKKIASFHAMRRRASPALADDINSAALEGLVQAARKFDPSKGVPFPAFASQRIAGAIGDFFRSMDHVGRHGRQKEKETGIAAPPAPISFEGVENLAELIPDVAAPDPLVVADRNEQLRILERAAQSLPEKLKTILRLRYAVKLSLQQIGDALNFTESRACQMLADAHEALSAALEMAICGKLPAAPAAVAPSPPETTKEILARRTEERRAMRQKRPASPPPPPMPPPAPAPPALAPPISPSPVAIVTPPAPDPVPPLEEEHDADTDDEDESKAWSPPDEDGRQTCIPCNGEGIDRRRGGTNCCLNCDGEGYRWSGDGADDSPEAIAKLLAGVDRSLAISNGRPQPVRSMPVAPPPKGNPLFYPVPGGFGPVDDAGYAKCLTCDGEGKLQRGKSKGGVCGNCAGDGTKLARRREGI